jgi:acetoin utilization deacetylase AcuC-like enzyme
MSLRLWYCDHHEIPLPPGHKFPMRKYRLLRDLLAADGVFRMEPSAPAEPATIELVHDPAYVRDFLAGTIEPRAMRRIGFPWSEALVRRTLGSVGGTLAATADALATGFGGNLAGGTHHAFRGEGSGFCVFNDIAIAIRSVERRAAVVDLDVHQGDGTALIFEDDPGVLTLSMHGAGNFPFRKQRSRIDVELPDRTGDEEYLARLAEVLPRVFDFQPRIIFYQSGVDALAGDKLGRLSLTHDGLRERDRMVIGAAHRRGIPLVITLGGGYADPIERTAEAHANTFRTAAERFSAAPPSPAGSPDRAPSSRNSP